MLSSKNCSFWSSPMMMSVSSLASRDDLRQSLDIRGAPCGALAQELGIDLVLDRRIGLREQFAVGARLAVLVQELAALGVDLGVPGVVLGRAREQRTMRASRLRVRSRPCRRLPRFSAIPVRVSGVHGFGEPLGRQFVSDSGRTRLLVDDMTGGGELVAHAEIVEEARHLRVAGAALDAARS